MDRQLAPTVVKVRASRYQRSLSRYLDSPLPIMVLDPSNRVVPEDPVVANLFPLSPLLYQQGQALVMAVHLVRVNPSKLLP